MTREEAKRKLEFFKKAYQKLIDEKVSSGKLVGDGVRGEWKAGTSLDEVYKDAIKALDMAINALEVTGIGYWLATENEDMEVIGYYCSRCDLPMETDEKTNYCPNCGARMVEPIGK